jgi:hypothetical protein
LIQMLLKVFELSFDLCLQRNMVSELCS